MFLNRSLFGLKIASNSLKRYFRGFLSDLGFKTSISDQDLWIQKYDNYEVYDYITTHVNYVIIVANNPFRYMHEIEMHFTVMGITDIQTTTWEINFYEVEIVIMFH